MLQTKSNKVMSKEHLPTGSRIVDAAEALQLSATEASGGRGRLDEQLRQTTSRAEACEAAAALIEAGRA